MRESKFLKKEDVGAGALMTVESCEQHNVAKQGAPPENKWCLTFAESDKPLVINSTNAQLCAKSGLFPRHCADSAPSEARPH
jgi:hypothetical protein